MTMNSDINFLYEVGCLRFVQRSWRHFLNADFANVSEHIYRVIWLALVIAKHEKCADTEMIMKMALVHDLTEIRASDVDYLSRQYVTRNEVQAAEDMLAPTVLKDEFLAIWHAYEKRDTLAAQIVKDADNLDVDMELMEQKSRGVPLSDKWHVMRTHVAEEKLYTATAQKMWKEIQESDPHDWHLSSRNRFSSGDWQQTKK
ncbi:HD domain-containing protein [Candidatus Woesebacteria bacterium]|nr:HD domain-containing protein [Candidatus Woesebacteria bacterium]